MGRSPRQGTGRPCDPDGDVALNLFLISDTHFGHANIIKYCNRPFSCVEEMDETMVDRWNAVVRPSDHVYHLGDVAMRKADLAIVKRLNGKKRLVMGNHDVYEVRYYLAAGFQKVCGIRVLDRMLLTHIPVHPGSLGRFRANVHGHVHNNQALTLPYINVSAEVIDYRPVALDDLRRRVESA